MGGQWRTVQPWTAGALSPTRARGSTGAAARRTLTTGTAATEQSGLCERRWREASFRCGPLPVSRSGPVLPVLRATASTATTAPQSTDSTLRLTPSVTNEASTVAAVASGDVRAAHRHGQQHHHQSSAVISPTSRRDAPVSFRCLYLTASCTALLLPALYLLLPFLTPAIDLPPISIVILLVLCLTLPRLLFLSAVLHRGFAHEAFTATLPMVERLLRLCCLLSFHPYSLTTWRQRHLHFHAHALTANLPAQHQPEANANEAAAQPLPSTTSPPLLLRLFQPVLDEDVAAASAQPTKKASGQFDHLPAAAFNLVALLLIRRALSSHGSSPLLSSSLQLLVSVSILCLSQLLLWLTSAFLLDHSLALPLLGYQLHPNPHYNSVPLSLLTLGGSYLNTHHACPTSPSPHPPLPPARTRPLPPPPLPPHLRLPHLPPLPLPLLPPPPPSHLPPSTASSPAASRTRACGHSTTASPTP